MKEVSHKLVLQFNVWNFFIVGGTFGAIVGGTITEFGPKFEGGAMTVLTISYLILTPLTISYRFIEPSGLFFILLYFLYL